MNFESDFESIESVSNERINLNFRKIKKTRFTTWCTKKNLHCNNDFNDFMEITNNMSLVFTFFKLFLCCFRNGSSLVSKYLSLC